LESTLSWVLREGEERRDYCFSMVVVDPMPFANPSILAALRKLARRDHAAVLLTSAVTHPPERPVTGAFASTATRPALGLLYAAHLDVSCFLSKHRIHTADPTSSAFVFEVLHDTLGDTMGNWTAWQVVDEDLVRVVA